MESCFNNYFCKLTSISFYVEPYAFNYLFACSQYIKMDN